MNNTNNSAQETGTDALAKAAEIRKSTQVPNTTASSHEIHGEIGVGGSASDSGSFPLAGI